jgi:hypothetical protein
MKRVLSKELKADVRDMERPILDMILGLPEGTVGLDSRRKHILFGSTTEFLGARSNALTVGHLGLDKILVVQSFALDQDIRKWAPIFVQVHETVRLDDGFQFDPAARSQVSDRFRDVVFSALFVAVLIAIISFLIRRNRRLHNSTDSAEL